MGRQRAVGRVYISYLDQPTQPSLTSSTDQRVRGSAGPLAIWAGMIVLYFVWGSTYIGIRLAVESIPPFLMAGIRFVIAVSYTHLTLPTIYSV